MKKNNKKGFTLIEMLVVIAIIAVLVAIIIPTVTSSTAKAEAAATAANLRSLKAEITTGILTGDAPWGEIDLDAPKTYGAGTGETALTTEQAAAVARAVKDVSKFSLTIGTDKSITVKYDSKTIAQYAAAAGNGETTPTTSNPS